jgi:glycosyltransferase involved in cell wall biosynthesis
MDLQAITPVVITFNEEPNIGRTLARLTWARRVVMVDSGSTDATLELAKRFPNVEVVHRKFDNFAGQCNFALDSTGIDTEWVLSLDADYVLSDELVTEIAALEPGAGDAGYATAFTYCIDGAPLRGSLYPPVTVLYRRTRARYRQDGHAHRVVVDGAVHRMQAKIFHDDRKPLSRWLSSQASYAAQEAEKILAAPARELSWTDRVRLVPGLAPVAATLYAGILRGCVLDGKPGLAYIGQRAIAESILMLEILQRRSIRKPGQKQ